MNEADVAFVGQRRRQGDIARVLPRFGLLGLLSLGLRQNAKHRRRRLLDLSMRAPACVAVLMPQRGT
jgi:hypothetical protein